MTEMLAVADIVDVLEALCTCEGETPCCTYCDAREEIEGLRRTLQLAQADLARLRSVAAAGRALVAEVDRKHDELQPMDPLRYAVPWGKVTELRKTIEALG